MLEWVEDSGDRLQRTRPWSSWDEITSNCYGRSWRDINDAFRLLVSAHEVLEGIEVAGGTKVLSMSFELAVGSVCTALLALDDYRDNASLALEATELLSPEVVDESCPTTHESVNGCGRRFAQPAPRRSINAWARARGLFNRLQSPHAQPSGPASAEVVPVWSEQWGSDA
jgi:hypothetical protein